MALIRPSAAIVALAYAVALLATACSKSSPPPPEVTPPSGAETINGTERLGWTQRATDAVELATVRYAIYVDGTRSELADASCGAAAAADGFACSARLPTLTAGAHTLELASFTSDGSVLESARSAALRVTVVAQVESAVKTGTARVEIWRHHRPTPLSPTARVSSSTGGRRLESPGGPGVRPTVASSSLGTTPPFAREQRQLSSRLQSLTDG